MERTPAGAYDSAVRRAVIFAATLALTAVASYEMYRVLSVIGMTTPAACAADRVYWQLCVDRAVICERPGRTPSSLAPIYNEDPSRIFAGLQAIYESLDALGAMASFDFFILSDTTDPEVWLEEERGFYALRQRTAGDTHIFYRHRRKNTRRKAGNIADFCQRWGARYEHMVILDADSLMTGEALVRLAAAMESQPRWG